MQLNVYVPKTKARLLELLDQTARRTRRQKNQLVLEALEAYLVAERGPGFEPAPLGVFRMPSREELYGDRLNRSVPTE